MTTVFGFCGFKGAGKDTAANVLVERGFVKDSFAAPLKDICSIIFGWDRKMMEGDTPESREWREQVDVWWAAELNIPDFSPRRALQLVGTDALRNVLSNDLWSSALDRRVGTIRGNYVIVDGRFPNEFSVVRKNGGRIYEIWRGDPEWRPLGEEIGRIAYAEYIGEAEPNAHKQHPRYEELLSYAHPSEWMWLGCPKDGVIMNTGSIEDLKIEVTCVI